MITEERKLALFSLNTRGLGNRPKRVAMFEWLKEKHKGIVLLQETHSTAISENTWSKDFDGDIYYSHGTATSRGVAILIPSGLDTEIKDVKSDNEGRILLLDIMIDSNPFIILNIYAPTQDKTQEQNKFIENVQDILANYIDRNIVIGGDFNTYLNATLDKKGSAKQINTTYSKSIIDMMEDYNLIDIWRTINPEVKRYTWRGMTKAGQVHSRLDYFLISTHMIYEFEKADILPSIKSDHSLLKITFKLQNTIDKGRGFWKFNSSLLNNTEYVNKINEIIEDSKTKYIDIENKAVVWDLTKCDIRGATVSYSSHLAKTSRAREKALTDNKRHLEEQIDKLDNSNSEFKQALKNYNEVKEELDNINEYKANGHILRSKANWIENGEKCTKYFMQLESRNYKTKYIKAIQVEKHSITNPTEILKEQAKFYEKLYSEPKKDKCENECNLFDIQSPKLSQDDKTLCDKDITLEECAESVRNLANNKSPGSDGFTTNFYKFFWGRIKDLVFNSFQYAYETGELSIEQKRAILTLLPKPNKDLRDLKNWRPISLLNTDYKILARIFSARLQKVLPSLISDDQTGYLKDRCIGENVRTILDVIEYTATKFNPGLVIFLDFEKAFDSISWSFLQKTLKHFNFGSKFQEWIKIFYNNITSCIINNGHSTHFFKLQRGIRQGCPLSALLFILVVEVMANKIKLDCNVKGLNFHNVEIKLKQLADDTTLFLKDKQSLENALQILQHFHTCAGLKLNKTKTQAMKLGSCNNIDVEKLGIGVVEETKTLAIIVTKDSKEINERNFVEKYEKVKNLLNMWRARNLTLKGKVTLVKNKVLPMVLYTASMLYIDKETVTKFDKLFFSFIWPSGKHHVPQNVISQPIKDGGLNMPKLDIMVVVG